MSPFEGHSSSIDLPHPAVNSVQFISKSNSATEFAIHDAKGPKREWICRKCIRGISTSAAISIRKVWQTEVWTVRISMAIPCLFHICVPYVEGWVETHSCSSRRAHHHVLGPAGTYSRRAYRSSFCKFFLDQRALNILSCLSNRPNIRFQRNHFFHWPPCTGMSASSIPSCSSGVQSGSTSIRTGSSGTSPPTYTVRPFTTTVWMRESPRHDVCDISGESSIYFAHGL